MIRSSEPSNGGGRQSVFRNFRFSSLLSDTIYPFSRNFRFSSQQRKTIYRFRDSSA